MRNTYDRNKKNIRRPQLLYKKTTQHSQSLSHNMNEPQHLLSMKQPSIEHKVLIITMALRVD